MATQKERSSSNGSLGTTPTPPPVSGLQTEEGTRPAAESTEIPGNQAAGFDSNMMENFLSFMFFYKQHQQAAPAQSNNSNNNRVTPMSLDGNLQKPPAETVLRWIDESWEAVPDELVKKAFVTCGISTSIDGTEDHLILAHMRDKGEVEVLDDVNEMVDDETVVNPFYAEVPMPAEELQVEEEDDAAEAEAEAEDEEGVGLADGEEAGECSDDDDWWRPGRFDGEEIEEWHAGDDDE
ncbi:unnamed protein product [Closterium sp. NIES-54]